jgi:hypothetical protein
MHYGFQVRVGDASYGEWVKIGAAKAAPSDLDEVRVGITGKPNEDALLVADFLDSHSERLVYPTLFQGMGYGFGPCYARVGGLDYQLATPEKDATLIFDGFRWTDKDTVQFILVAYSDMLAYADWEKMHLDWTRVPVEMQLVNLRAAGHDDGPVYASTLNYVGQLFTGNPSLAPGQQKPDGPIEEWAAQVRKSPDELRMLVDGVDPRNFGSAKSKSSSYHLFAAHFALDYFMPDGDQVKSLRPFGRTLTSPDHYRIGLRNLHTPKDCGLEKTKLEAPVSKSWTSRAGYSMPEYEFHFLAPKSHSAGVPWANLPEERRKKWIEEEGKKRNPNIELITK